MLNLSGTLWHTNVESMCFEALIPVPLKTSLLKLLKYRTGVCISAYEF